MGGAEFSEPQTRGERTRQDKRSPAAPAVVTLIEAALAAPDLPSGIAPLLEYVVRGTSAVGSVYVQVDRSPGLDPHVRASWSDLLRTPDWQLLASHGVAENAPLRLALQRGTEPLFFGDTRLAGETQAFPALGVAGLAAAPVRRADGQLLGALLIYTLEPHCWQPGETRLFSLVTRAASALAGRLAAEEEVYEAREATLRALGLALEARDGGTRGHTDRVMVLALHLADHLHLTPAQRQALRWGAYLHDVGKLAIPDAILLKPGRLTSEEWRAMRAHVTVGQEFARGLRFLPALTLAVITDHHERWDGQGYPRGTAGRQISLGGRLFALCDVYDALVSARPYKLAWTHEAARAEIQAQSGKHFDPDLAALFLRVVVEKQEDAHGA